MERLIIAACFIVPGLWALFLEHYYDHHNTTKETRQ
jgi:hypothetical protein